MNYWELILKDGESIDVRPEMATKVQKAIAERRPITTPTRSIVFSEIKDFRISDKPYSDQKLIEDAAQVFRDPIYNPDGSIQSCWVKRPVTKRKWDGFYRFHPSYRRLEEQESLVIIAFTSPLHQINYDYVQKVSPEEEERLSSFVNSRSL